MAVVVRHDHPDQGIRSAVINAATSRAVLVNGTAVVAQVYAGTVFALAQEVALIVVFDR